jgi:CRP-like cAMP-binding protein
MTITSPPTKAAPRTAHGDCPTADLIQNRILAVLPAAELAALRPHFSRIDLPVYAMLRMENARMEDLYFPSAGMVSSVVAMENGLTVEVAIVGREGMVDVSALLGYGETPGASSFVQVRGEGFAIGAKHIEEVFTANQGLLPSILRRYISAQWSLMARGAACNRLHNSEQRFSRWLLMTMDRVGSDFAMTHEFLGQMLGSRRATVTVEAQKLQAAGILRYNHGKMCILKRKSLEDTACECYRLQDLDGFLKP